MRDLGPVGRGFMDLNDAGQIVGTVEDPNGLEQAFVWDPNAGMQLLAVPGAIASRAHAINNRGWVVGSYKTADDTSHAFIWDRMRGIRELGTSEDRYRQAWDLNDAGQVVVFVKGGTLLVNLDDDGAVSGRARVPLRGPVQVNNHGAVGGWSEAKTGEYEAMVWYPDSGRKSVRLIAEDVGFPHLNDLGQLCVGEEWHSRFKVLGRTLWRRRHSRAYLSDPRRGRITLNGYVSLGRDEYLWVNDLNNDGCIIGAVQSDKRVTSRGVLLEPIPERWEK
jgi:probable HAF family extracellular repeat protein